MSSWFPLRTFVVAAALLAAPAVAADGEVASARASAALLDECLQGILPAAVALPRALGDDTKKTFFVNELRYCGPGDKGRGRFRAAGRLGAGEDRKDPLLAGAEACRQGLAEIAERASPPLAAGTLLLDLEASWKGWELSLGALSGLVADQEGRTRAMSGSGKPVEIATVRTADLRIDSGAGAPIVLHARPVFLAGAIEVAIVLADKPPTKAPPTEPGARGEPFAGEANLAAEIPAAFANQVLRRLTGTRPLVIPVHGEEVEISDVTLTGQGAGRTAQLSVAGNASPRSMQETVRWRLLAAGEPLRVSSLAATAQLEDCSTLGSVAAIGCNLRNGARSAAAEAFAQAFRQRYQGSLVHELASPVDLRFTLAGQRVLLHGDLVQTAYSARGLLVAGQLRGK